MKSLLFKAQEFHLRTKSHESTHNKTQSARKFTEFSAFLRRQWTAGAEWQLIRIFLNQIKFTWLQSAASYFECTTRIHSNCIQIIFHKCTWHFYSSEFHDEGRCQNRPECDSVGVEAQAIHLPSPIKRNLNRQFPTRFEKIVEIASINWIIITASFVRNVYGLSINLFPLSQFKLYQSMNSN